MTAGATSWSRLTPARSERKLGGRAVFLRLPFQRPTDANEALRERDSQSQTGPGPAALPSRSLPLHPFFRTRESGPSGAFSSPGLQRVQSHRTAVPPTPGKAGHSSLTSADPRSHLATAQLLLAPQSPLQSSLSPGKCDPTSLGKESLPRQSSGPSSSPTQPTSVRVASLACPGKRIRPDKGRQLGSRVLWSSPTATGPMVMPGFRQTCPRRESRDRTLPWPLGPCEDEDTVRAT